MAGIPLTGPINLDRIRQELIITDSNFSLDDAENGVYATINPCSQYKPSLANPTTLSEWYGYDHSAPCNSYEYMATISDIGTSGSCEQIFDYTEARLNVSLIPFNVIMIGASNNPYRNLRISNIEKMPSVRVEVTAVMNNGGQYVLYAYEGNGASYVPWNLIPNTSTEYWGELDIKTSRNPYIVKIWYGDGSGRVETTKCYFINPKADGYYQTPVYYSASADSVCSVNTFLDTDVVFLYPFTAANPVYSSVYFYYTAGQVPNGYYRMYRDPTTVYQVINNHIVGITSC